MRFAYIDSNGNEVPIPSVDALALRIELGAISDDTQLYDAQADQWGPAHTHEIFHSLSRTAAGDEGFMAPPPVARAPAEAASRESGAEPASTSKAPPVAKKGSSGSGDSLGLTLAEAVPEDEPAADSGEMDLELSLSGPAPPAEGGRSDAKAGPAARGGDDEAPAHGSFDFGDLGGGLEMESGFGDASKAPAMDFGGFGATEAESGPSMEFGFGTPVVGGGGLDLEQPMSQFDPTAPPAWMDTAKGPGGGGAVLDFSAAAGDATGADAAEDEVPLRSRRTPRNKPSAPKFKSQRNLVGPIVGVVILLALGLGGYAAWPIISARLAQSGEPAEPVSTLPSLPEELLPQLRSVGAAAFVAAFREARTGAQAAPNPPQEWLAGVYLADAGRFPAVETFWNGIEDVLSRLRALDADAFRVHYERAMASSGVGADNREVLLTRAVAGFGAAAGAREATYALVDDLIDAALRLHEFLLANEENIDYVPASTITTDPILEARPSTAAVGDAMSDRIGAVTGALRALDYLDLVTADGLWAAVLERIQAVGVQ